MIEVDQRRRHKESPTADEYLRRFPDHARYIRQAFVESVSLATEDATDPGRTISAARPAASRLGDYELIAKLGQGAFGVVWKARHLRQGHTVALKTLPLEHLERRPGGEDSRDVHREEGDRLHFFKREFRTLADINHPNLIGLHSLECDAGQWFFTMDLVEGVDFLSYIRPHGELDEMRLRSSLAQLVSGVMALHGHHIVHRDLKPSNVLVNEAGKIKILDFGLVVELREHAGTVSRIAGTPQYMAPEQAAGHAPTTAADWYAVGTMLYESLVGQRPYQADSWPQMLQLKQKEDPRALSDQPGVPADLADLCMHLLAREPQQRPDALAIAKALSTPVSVAASSAATGSQRLIGRESQLAALQTSLDTLRQQPEPQILFISGRSGEGKTSLAEQFLEPLRKQPRLTVLSGRCYDRESVPFKAIDNLIDALCIHLRSLPGEDVALMLPDDIGFLTHLFPGMLRVDVIGASGGNGWRTWMSSRCDRVRLRRCGNCWKGLPSVGR